MQTLAKNQPKTPPHNPEPGWLPHLRKLAIKMPAGKKALFFNVAYPTADHQAVRLGNGNLMCGLGEMVCQQCGKGYSHLARGAGQPCDECRAENTAAFAAELEAAGIPLGSTSGPTDGDLAFISGYRDRELGKDWDTQRLYRNAQD